MERKKFGTLEWILVIIKTKTAEGGAKSTESLNKKTVIYKRKR